MNGRSSAKVWTPTWSGQAAGERSVDGAFDRVREWRDLFGMRRIDRRFSDA